MGGEGVGGGDTGLSQRFEDDRCALRSETFAASQMTIRLCSTWMTPAAQRHPTATGGPPGFVDRARRNSPGEVVLGGPAVAQHALEPVVPARRTLCVGRARNLTPPTV